MILFHKKARYGEGTKLVVLFGTGLIGTSICNSIIRKSEYSSSALPFDWNNSEQRRYDITRIFNALCSILQLHPQANLNSCKIAFVWSAGKAGFAASKQNMKDELTSFDIVLDLARNVENRFPAVHIFFHLLSSAGGLFEGQRLVHEASTPKPIRYYGQLKYEQEKRLLKLGEGVVKRIYRPTSVYGFIGPGKRLGLIPTLISNGIKNRVSTIYGELNTLREYIFNGDIGTYIGNVLFPDHISSANQYTHLLGSGKPSSIYEIRYLVEQVLGRKIYLEFRSTPETDNAKDITVSSSALPDSWAPQNVKSGIRYVKERILSCKIYTILEN